MKTDDYLIDVALLLRGDHLDPEIVSKEVNIAPSSAQRKGEKKITTTKHEYTTQIGVWQLIADSDSSILSDHIDQLVSQIGTSCIALRDIEGVEEAYIDIFIAGDADEDGEGTCEFELSKKNVVSLAHLGLPVYFTVALVKK